MNRTLASIIVASLLLAGCASVPMENAENTAAAKAFSPPPAGSAGLYVYRSGSFGGALKKDVWVDGTCIGETAPNVFFYQAIKGGVEHKISTESEFSANDVALMAESGKNYFVQQFIKMGLFVGGAGLELVDEQKGRKEVADLKLATKGHCSK